MQIYKALERLEESPLSAASGVIATICSGYGIFEAGSFVAGKWGSEVLAVGVSFLLVVCLLPFIARQFFWSLRRRFHLPIEERFIYAQAKRRWGIKANGEASLETTNEYLFFRLPEREDLVDTFFASETLDEAKMKYTSPDSRVVDAERIANNTWKFYWQPKSGSIEVAKSYQHTFSTEFPVNRNFTSKSFTVAVPVFTLSYRIEIMSELPITRYFCYRRRPWQPFHGHAQIVRRAQTVKRRLAPQLQQIDAYRLIWETENLSAGDTLFIVLLFENNAAERAA
jgi:hypothetical protein